VTAAELRALKPGRAAFQRRGKLFLKAEGSELKRVVTGAPRSSPGGRAAAGCLVSTPAVVARRKAGAGAAGARQAAGGWACARAQGWSGGISSSRGRQSRLPQQRALARPPQRLPHPWTACRRTCASRRGGRGARRRAKQTRTAPGPRLRLRRAAAAPAVGRMRAPAGPRLRPQRAAGMAAQRFTRAAAGPLLRWARAAPQGPAAALPRRPAARSAGRAAWAPQAAPGMRASAGGAWTMFCARRPLRPAPPPGAPLELPRQPMARTSRGASAGGRAWARVRPPRPPTRRPQPLHPDRSSLGRPQATAADVQARALQQGRSSRGARVGGRAAQLRPPRLRPPPWPRRCSPRAPMVGA